MKIRSLFPFALFAGTALCQSNAVPGLDLSMFEVTDLGYTGRRGAAFPNGEAGFALGHSWCNAGSVHLPWLSEVNGVMVDSFPRIAFLLVRESGGRIVQVSNKSFCKYSPTAYNFQSGPCAPCQAGSGQFFFVGCSDTYGSGINQSQYNLGPSTELDPWLGTWNPAGSYFDHGDPAVTGPAAVDSVRSLTFTQVQAFDAVKNRMEVRESELLANAVYYGQVQAVVQGEPLSARGNNIANRQLSITASGGNWVTNSIGNSLVGSVLTRWQGATVNLAGNGNDDGRFAVAVKVTGPTNGMWHYEYAVHNIDNHRGGAGFHIPLAPGAVVANAGFRDIDTDPLNDWSASQTAGEIAFLAAASNAHDWNTIYNCWFDCSIPPGAGAMTIDQARIGPGNLDVTVQIPVPSGLSFAALESLGTSCGLCTGTVYEHFATSTAFDLTGRSMTMALANGAYTVTGAPVAFVPPAGINLGLGLNTNAMIALPFAVPYPGGSTTNMQVMSSGYVSPAQPNPLQLAPSVSSFLLGQARWAPMWGVLSPSGANNVWYDANPTRAILTWNNVPSVVGTGTNTFQIQFFPNGTVHVVWQSIAASALPVMVGWTPGSGHYNPGATNLSTALQSTLALCAQPFDGLTLALSANPILGTAPQWQIGGILPGTAWGLLARSLQQATPPLDLSSYGMQGCFAHVVSPVTTMFLTPASTQTVGEPIPYSTALVGVTMVGQGFTFNPTLNTLGLVASNGMKLLLGL